VFDSIVTAVPISGIGENADWAATYPHPKRETRRFQRVSERMMGLEPTTICMARLNARDDPRRLPTTSRVPLPFRRRASHLEASASGAER
jgi:hypothetical protein